VTRKQLHVALDAVGGRDARSGLDAVGLLASWLTERESELVAMARRSGWTWDYIAQRLGRTRQSVWEKHRNIEEGDSR
jgi:hypothetical protein